MKKNIFFKTFGCRTNLFDTQVMMENIKDHNIVDNVDDAEIVIVNSCTVTNGADSGVRHYLNSLKSKGKKIYFTGCGVKHNGAKLQDLNLVFGVFSHEYKEEINKIINDDKKLFLDEAQYRKINGDKLHIDTTIVSDYSSKSRAFLKIQEGCNFACSYCIIPSVRGASRSYDMEAIINQVKILADSGVQEIVLTGTNVGSYGTNKPYTLSSLIKAIAKIRGIKRIRVGSLESVQINDEFIELLNEDFLEKHLHIALQYTEDGMLVLMNRRNRVETDMQILEKLSLHNISIGTDYIVGHPSEDEAIFSTAYTNLNLMPITHIHPFIYSIREGTKSAELSQQYGQINGKIAKERLHKINALIEGKNIEFREKIKKDGKSLEVLIESSKKEGNIYISRGLDQYFNKVILQSLDSLNGIIKINDFEVKKDANYVYLQK